MKTLACLIALVIVFTPIVTLADDPWAGFGEKQIVEIYAIFKVGKKGYTMVRGGMASEYDTDTTPFIKNDRIMLPMRTIGEVLEMDVNFDKNTRIAFFSKDEDDLKYKIDINIDTGEVKVNGNPFQNIKDYLEVKDGRIYVSLFKITEILKYTPEETLSLSWNKETKEAFLYLTNMN